MESFPNRKRDLTPISSVRLSEPIYPHGGPTDGMADIENEVKVTLREMEEGVRVDVHTLISLKSDYLSALSRLKKEMQAKSGMPVRVDSNRELGDLLFRDLGLPSLRSTPSGKPSVTISVLERLCDYHSDAYPFLRSLIELKKVQALIKSAETVSKKLDLLGRIHPEFNDSTCATGRIYSYIQNLPKEVRRVLIPDTDEDETEFVGEEEELYAGLSISVSLPRKKVRGLEILSGGEVF